MDVYQSASGEGCARGERDEGASFVEFFLFSPCEEVPHFLCETKILPRADYY